MVHPPVGYWSCLQEDLSSLNYCSLNESHRTPVCNGHFRIKNSVSFLVEQRGCPLFRDGMYRAGCVGDLTPRQISLFIMKYYTKPY